MKFRIFVLSLLLAGCATAPLKPSTITMPSNSALTFAKPITIQNKPVTRMCLFSGRVYTMTSSGERNYL